jgi:hypothetical protein
MAKYKELDDQKPIVSDKDDPNQTFLTEMRARFERCVDYDRDMRQAALDDMKFTFVPGNQWDVYTRGLRSSRPCYEFNKVRQSVRQVTGDQLQNRPGIKVIPVEDGDIDTAEVYEGLIRNIESTSHADRAYDNAFLYSATGGYGVWRIITDYRDDDDFDQDIYIKPVLNPYSAYCDPDAKEFDRRDSQFWFLSDHMGKEAFKQKYPDADLTNFESGDTVGEGYLSWFDGDRVRICEYWYKDKEDRTIGLLSSGEVVDMADFDEDLYAESGITVSKTRDVTVDKVKMEIVSGSQRLEGPYEWAGKFIPIVPVWGDIINVDGRDEWSGMVRFAKDAQRLFNFEQSTLVELVAKQPQQPLTGPAEGIKGYESFYENLSDQDVPFLPYNVVPGSPNGGAPQRVAPATFPAAWANLSAMSSDNIKATLGIYDASLGARSNETSGVAIRQRQQEGDVANFVYTDNLAKALKYTGEILVDLIPKIYDTERVIRVLGKDGGEKWVNINKGMQNPATGDWEVINDLSQGKYDATVSVGPSYTTQRQELADAAMHLSQQPGPGALLWQLAYMENSDFPNGEKYVKAFRQFLINQGLIEPEEGDNPRPQPQPPQPDPKDIADANLKQSQARNYDAKTQEVLATMPSKIAVNDAGAKENMSKALRNIGQDARDEHQHQVDLLTFNDQAPVVPAATPADLGGAY